MSHFLENPAVSSLSPRDDEYKTPRESSSPRDNEYKTPYEDTTDARTTSFYSLSSVSDPDRRLESLNIQDPRIVDLDHDAATIPSRFEESTSAPWILTLCAGDGIQTYDGIRMTDMERIPLQLDSQIFLCCKNYNPEGLRENIAYLESHPALNIVLLLYDVFGNDKYKANLRRLMSNKIMKVNSDQSCYAPWLDLTTLDAILIDGGVYKADKGGDLTPPFHPRHYPWMVWFENARDKGEFELLPKFTVDLNESHIIKDGANKIVFPEKMATLSRSNTQYDDAYNSYKDRLMLDLMDWKSRRPYKGGSRKRRRRTKRNRLAHRCTRKSRNYRRKIFAAK